MLTLSWLCLVHFVAQHDLIDGTYSENPVSQKTTKNIILYLLSYLMYCHGVNPLTLMYNMLNKKRILKKLYGEGEGHRWKDMKALTGDTSNRRAPPLSTFLTLLHSSNHFRIPHTHTHGQKPETNIAQVCPHCTWDLRMQQPHQL